MEKLLEEFLKASLDLGIELLDKERLTDKEEVFLSKLELLMENNI